MTRGPFLRVGRAASLTLSMALAAASFDLPLRAHAEPATPKIPLVAGLTVVGAHHTPERDYERVSRVTAATAGTVTTLHRLQTFSAPGEPPKWAQKIRTVAKADLEKAQTLNQCYAQADPEMLPGTTDFQASAGVLEALKTQGRSPFTLVHTSSGIGMAAGLSLGARCKRFVGSLKHAGTADESFSLLLNGQRVTVPVLHAQGYLETDGGDGARFEFWFLDDAANPLWLKGTGDEDIFNFQVVRIDIAEVVAAAATPLATLAGKACRAELHGVYFESGSASLLPESADALAQVATMLKANVGWKVTVEGHTDSLGGAAPNLDLSTRRAVAVRDALIAQGGVSAAQLTTQGFGLTKPVETNDTPEGRARNRRVELSRQCP